MLLCVIHQFMEPGSVDKEMPGFGHKTEYSISSDVN